MAESVGPFFVNRDNGSLIRVREVDSSYAYLETLLPAPQTYSMPLADYDSIFVKMFEPASPANLRALSSSDYRPPLNAPSTWG